MKIVGVLLAGGRSSRFGSEKAVAPVGDGVLMDAPLQALAGSCDDLAISAREGSGAAHICQSSEYALLSDSLAAPEGPLRGVLAGLAWAKSVGAQWMATAPCDAAGLDAARMRVLIATAVSQAKAAAAASDQGLEPLVAVWPVDEGFALVSGALDTGRHPAVRELLAHLNYVQVDGFDAANVNRPQDLPAGVKASDEPDHARLFGFEDDFVRTLRCIPMCVRFKLDRVGIKLSLRQWSRFSLADRQDLRLAPCADGAQAAKWRQRLIDLIADRAGEDAAPLVKAPDARWSLPATPPEILQLAADRQLAAPSDEQWRSLTELERYALVKLTRDRHENANLGPALAEFRL
ncbi:MAG: nitrate reductase associated protein [Caulobacter sp.]